MREEIDAQVLTIFVGEDDKLHGALLYAAIVDRLSQAGIAGATVLHGIEGYGARHKLHTDRFEALFQCLPVVIEAVDTREKIQKFLPALDQMIASGLVTVHDVQAIKYAKD